MEESLKSKLEEQIQEARWDWLAPHHARGALVWVSMDLELAEVGFRMAENDAVAVQNWLSTGQLQRPLDFQTEAWADPAKRFLFLIVQPFVLFQEQRVH